MVYPNFHTYLKSIEDVQARIQKICDIIDYLEDALLAMAENESATLQSYEIDSGQSKVQMNYRSPTQIMATISGLERRKNKLLRELDGGATKLVFIK